MNSFRRASTGESIHKYASFANKVDLEASPSTSDEIVIEQVQFDAPISAIWVIGRLFVQSKLQPTIVLRRLEHRE